MLRVALLIALAGASALAQDPGTARVVGVATTQGSGQALPYVDVAVERDGLTVATTLGTEGGRFQLDRLTAGRATLRVRRIGFTPVTVDLVLRAGAVDTVRVALAPLSLRLDLVKVSAPVCPGRRAGAVDTAVLAVLEQVRQNAERNRLLVRDYPFVARMERTIADELFDRRSPDRVAARQVMQLDTIDVASDHEWRYAPGRMVAEGRLVIPQLVDFADEPFTAAHCFRYRGVQSLDGDSVVRVDFEPAKGVPEPDVRGSLYLDPRSYRIRRSTLFVETRAVPPHGADVWEIRIDTWFREAVPSLPVIDRVSSQTTIREDPANRGRSQARRATEVQRTLGVEYLDARPDRSPPSTRDSASTSP